jgi:hypothetical protein
MIQNESFREFIKLINKNEVDYLVVGEYALSFHGKPCASPCMEIWISAAVENAMRIMAAICEFGSDAGHNPAAYGIEDFIQKYSRVRIGRAPLRIDILNTMDGLVFDESHRSREEIDIRGIKIPFINFRDFVYHKRLSGSLDNREDFRIIKKLGKAKGE